MRKDTPLIKAPARGSITKALDAGSIERRPDTLERLRRDEVAASGQVPRASRWRTWVRLHKNWLPDEEVLPLTIHKIEAVMAS